MIINFQTLQDTLIALFTVVGIAALVAIGIVAVAGLVERDKRRNREAAALTPSMALHPTQTDRVRELVSH